ncbi:MAG: hypothetical protein AB7E51_14300 [Pseudodesulfovibrio sp.]|jgi:hypothetical protein|uniref:Type II secretion system protein GspN n=1 Tax=Pseudodesulfovibrio indicus TaxID=1716143 RepID=A0A126QJ81_9BACT|nr:hypothetical protein [Pseudodesulfovibrio indicus]AMK10042.1 hypothetical protein AWY79_02385 [Pseudodesulfovibrio indicus]TDT86990.1 hypothetical protein EDC59_11071 [Pseudodesulfovibrio indicus]
MAERKRTKPSSLPGRILARLFLVVLGFAVGVVLFTPWNKIWANALTRLDASQPAVGLTWGAIDRDGPLGFRLRDFKISVAQTPGRLHFKQAYVSVGFSPLATVRLDTGGPQCRLELFSNGVFDFEGDLDLTYLLGDSDLKGVLRASGSLFLPEGARLPKNGWVDVRSQQLVLPGDKVVEDLAFTAEIENEHMAVRDFSIRLPLTYKSSGTAVLDPDNLFRTRFNLKGDMTVGREVFAYEMNGTLGDAMAAR